ncbi:MAG TPA: alpha/beta hydrolase [Solirubrobacteraceae bacterium]
MTGLDPQAQDLLDVMAAAGVAPIHIMSVSDARERMRATLIPRGAPLALANVEDVSVPTPDGPLGVRLYRPTEGVLPVALFFHGGGWTLNDLDTHDDLCRRLAQRSGWLLISVDYRRAPEHKHPAPLDDAFHAYRWLLDNRERLGCDSTAPSVVGESSGATIAAALTHRLRDDGIPMPSYQILAYPLLDLPERWPSYHERGDGYMLDRAQLEWYLGHYLPAECDLEDPYLFPLKAQSFAGLPPALVMTAEFDPLRDSGVAYAEKLSQHGVPVEHVHVADQMHGFLLLGRVVAKAASLLDRVADALSSHSTAARGA